MVLDHEQRNWISSCLKREGFVLNASTFRNFVSGVEASIEGYRTAGLEPSRAPQTPSSEGILQRQHRRQRSAETDQVNDQAEISDLSLRKERATQRQVFRFHSGEP